MTCQYRYGRIRDKHNPNDPQYVPNSKFLYTALPPSVDLRSKCPPILNQGDLGSCTANAIGNAHYFEQLRQGSPSAAPVSRLFIYYNERSLEGTIDSDAGAAISDGIKSIVQVGVCPETSWKYDIGKFTVQPPQVAYSEAMLHQALKYQRVAQNITTMKTVLASGHPFVIGFTVYESFESAVVAKTGLMPMPNLLRERELGGHAVLVVGYDDQTSRLIVMNSWGPGWGAAGYFYMPYNFILNPQMAQDFWVLTEVETVDGPIPPPTPPPVPVPSAYRQLTVQGPLLYDPKTTTVTVTG